MYSESSSIEELQNTFYKKNIRNEQNIMISFTTLTEFPLYIFDNSQQQLNSLKEISIFNNRNLQKLDPGIFKQGLSSSNLKFLGISSNDNLKELNEDIFDDLTSLKTLHLKYNGLKEFSPKIFGENIKNSLTELYLNIDSVVKFPSKIFDGFINLKILDLRNNTKLNLEDENIFSSLISLRHLILRGCNLQSPLPSNLFNNLKNLGNLDLSYNLLTSISSGLFSSLKSLEILDLSYNRLKSIEPYIFMENNHLEKMDLTRNELSFDDIKDGEIFSGLSSLKELYITFNKTIASLPTNIFRNLCSLKKLDLSNNNNLNIIDEKAFNGLNCLENLVLHDNINLSYLPSDVLSCLSSLKELDLSNCALISLPDKIFKECGSLEILAISNNDKLVEFPSNIFEGKNLKGLPIKSIFFVYNISLKELPSSIKHLNHLKELHYIGCDNIVICDDIKKFIDEKKIKTHR